MLKLKSYTDRNRAGGKFWQTALLAAAVAASAQAAADDYLASFERGRGEMLEDRYRPAYHFVPPGGRMNDPNGLIRWQGRYHMFYQFASPVGAPGKFPAGFHWGHAVSDDLVSWRDLPPALVPEAGKGDAEGCWSGQLVIDGDRVVAMYYGNLAGNCVATSDDPMLVKWEKNPANPVIPWSRRFGLPYAVYDPCIWKEGDTFYSLSGGTRPMPGHPEIASDSGYLFKSKDLTHWEYLHPFYDGGVFTDPGEDGSVPSLVSLGAKHLLLFFSHRRGSQYYIGDFRDEKFLPQAHGRFHHAPLLEPDPRSMIGRLRIGNLHAPTASIGIEDRTLLVFNVKEGRSGPDWSVMTLPREVGLAGRLGLRQEPARELEKLRTKRVHSGAVDVAANAAVTLKGVAGDALEIAATIDPRDTRHVGFRLLRSPNGEEETIVSYYPATGTVSLDTSRSSVGPDVNLRPPEEALLNLAKEEPLELRIFVDRSIIEVFANGRQCLVGRVYPQRADSSGVQVFSRGGAAAVRSLDVWQMRDVWKEAAK